MMDPKFEPQWHIVVFGNGIVAKAKRVIQWIMEDNGIIITEFHISPSPEMMDYYNLKGADLNREGLIVVKYPQIEVIEPETKKGTIIRTFFILPDFEGGATPLTEMYPETKIIQRFQVEDKMLKSKIASLEEDIRLIQTRPEEYTKRKVVMFKRGRGAAGDIVEQGYVPEIEMPMVRP